MRVGRVHPPQLHALHQRHHWQAQGRATRHRRLHRGAGGQHEAHLQRLARPDFLHHQRHRLGGGPQLHHLRAADCRHGHGGVRRPADAPRPGHLVEHCGKVQGHAHVLGPDGGACAQKAGSGLAEKIRCLQPARPVAGGRAAGRADRALDQRRAAGANHRQLLADRNRLAHHDPGQWCGATDHALWQPGQSHVRLQRQAHRRGHR